MTETSDQIEKVRAFVEKAKSSPRDFKTATSETGIFFALDKKEDVLFIVFEGDDCEILSGRAVKTLREVII